MNRIEITEWIGKGAQHHVGKTEEGEIIKYPHSTGKYWDKSTYQSVRDDLSIHASWGIPIPQTEVKKGFEIDTGMRIIKPNYVLITEEVKGRVLKESDLTNSEIKEQLKNIIQRSLDIRKKLGKSLDLLGGEALVKFLRYLCCESNLGALGAYNLYLDDADRIVLIDTNTLDPARAPRIIEGFVRSMMDVQHSLLTELLDDQGLKERSLQENSYPAISRAARYIFKRTRPLEEKRKRRQNEKKKSSDSNEY